MELEIINKLYLELSQITTARSAREIAMVDALKHVNEYRHRLPPFLANKIDDALAKLNQ